jgi:hypothetical protein
VSGGMSLCHIAPEPLHAVGGRIARGLAGRLPRSRAPNAASVGCGRGGIAAGSRLQELGAARLANRLAHPTIVRDRRPHFRHVGSRSTRRLPERGTLQSYLGTISEMPALSIGEELKPASRRTGCQGIDKGEGKISPSCSFEYR